MRLLTFMQMAENRKDIDYDSIQKEMDISEDEVEDFIIDGMLNPHKAHNTGQFCCSLHICG